MRRRKTVENRIPVKKKHVLFGSVFALVSIVFSLLLFFPVVSAQFTPPAETEKTEVHELPPDIKKVLGESASAANYRIPILMYHYIEYVQDAKDTTRQALDTIPPILEEQILTLLQAHYTFITASKLGDVLNGKSQLPEKPILLTFDDGYRDFYTDAYPILKKYHVPATAYIVPGFLDKPNYMYGYQVRNIVDERLVEIGAHTVHHVWLKNMKQQEAQDEIQNSKKMIEEMFHTNVVSFAYPYGAFDTQAVDIVQKSGFWTAVSTVPGIQASVNNRFFLYRIRPGGRTGEELLNWLDQNSF